MIRLIISREGLPWSDSGKQHYLQLLGIWVRFPYSTFHKKWITICTNPYLYYSVVLMPLRVELCHDATNETQFPLSRNRCTLLLFVVIWETCTFRDSNSVHETMTIESEKKTNSANYKNLHSSVILLFTLIPTPTPLITLINTANKLLLGEPSINDTRYPGGEGLMGHEWTCQISVDSR